MRICSYCRSAWAGASKKAAANRYHRTSSSELDEVLNILRTTALPTLISTAARIHQPTALPTTPVNRPRSSRQYLHANPCPPGTRMGETECIG